MAIGLLRLADFRNFSQASLEPVSDGLNVFYGNNGSGKTSLLEAIHYISLGRSFRSGTSSQLVKHQTDKFVLFSQIIDEFARHVPIGVERELNGTSRLRVAENDAMTKAELAAFLPVRVINSHSHDLFEEGPVFRRKFLDWGLFYQFQSFLPCWHHYERVLKQRNTLLRERKPKRELDVWTEELLKYGLELTDLRRKYVQLLVPVLAQVAEELIGMSDLQVNYHPGWDDNEEYSAALAGAYPEECRLGYTHLGPHRADLDIHVDNIQVKHFLSRGQQKLLVCAMILAQGMLLSSGSNKRVIYLVDDLPSELDNEGRRKLISLLSRQNTQVFITSIEKESIFDWVDEKMNVPVKVFHVEHGNVR
jgi:DNA replication and repair protein RecF